jgi:hypothetical protein
MVQVSVLVPRPDRPVVVTPDRLLRSAEVIGLLKTTWMPVMVQGTSTRGEPTRL